MKTNLHNLFTDTYKWLMSVMWFCSSVLLGRETSKKPFSICAKPWNWSLTRRYATVIAEFTIVSTWYKGSEASINYDTYNMYKQISPKFYHLEIKTVKNSTLETVLVVWVKRPVDLWHHSLSAVCHTLSAISAPTSETVEDLFSNFLLTS